MNKTKLLEIVNEFRTDIHSNNIQVDIANDEIPEIELPDEKEMIILEKVLSKVGIEGDFAVALNDIITKKCAKL